MFIHRTQGVIRVVREKQFDLPTSQPLLTLLANSKEALESIGLGESAISRLRPEGNVAPMYRYFALVYPESVIGHLGAYENARKLPLGSNLTPAPVKFRWTIWGEIDWETVDDFDDADQACFTGVCARTELSELATQAAESNDTLLAYPIYEESQITEEARIFFDDPLEELHPLFAL